MVVLLDVLNILLTLIHSILYLILEIGSHDSLVVANVLYIAAASSIPVYGKSFHWILITTLKFLFKAIIHSLTSPEVAKLLGVFLPLEVDTLPSVLLFHSPSPSPTPPTLPARHSLSLPLPPGYPFPRHPPPVALWRSDSGPPPTGLASHADRLVDVGQ